MESLVPHPKPDSVDTSINWHKQTLFKCLLALGISREEMRYRKGCRYICESWVGERDNLIALVKAKWKEKVIRYHEANNGGDLEKWRLYNTIYSAAMRKIASQMPKMSSKNNFIVYDCIICGKTVRKECKTYFQYNSVLCYSPDCLKEYRRQKTQQNRQKYKTTYERYCINPNCGKRFFTTDNRKHTCCMKCSHRAAQLKWVRKNPNKVALLQARRAPWRERWAQLPEEEKERRREKHLAARRARLAMETPEQRAARLEKQRLYAREYRAKLAAKGIKPKCLSWAERLERKRIQYLDKPWLYETYVLKYGTKADKAKLNLVLY